MTWYRLYFLDAGERIGARDEFQADDEADAAALEREELLQQTQTRLAGSKRRLARVDQVKGGIALRRALSGS